jgi:hypothetical protein
MIRPTPWISSLSHDAVRDLFRASGQQGPSKDHGARDWISQQLNDADRTLQRDLLDEPTTSPAAKFSAHH